MGPKETPRRESGLMTVTVDDIRAAAQILEGHVLETPLLHSRTLSGILGAEVWLKFENLQFTSSFKERGAFVKLSSLTEEERRRGVIAVSAGNHAQAVAYHAQRMGIPAVIVMPETTPQVKVDHTRNFGAEVVLCGETLADCGGRAAELMAERNLVMVHPYDDDKIIAGQGTVGLEMCEAKPDLECIVVPIGGGGLISGIAIAAKALASETKIYGVEAALFPSMHNAIHGQSAACAGDTIAEGIAVKTPGSRTMPVVRDCVEEIVLCSETELEAAISLLLTVEKTLGEGAGAAGLAALAARPNLFKGRRVGVVISGGNIDARLLAYVLLRQQAKSGRLLSIQVEIRDRPGSLAKIVDSIAAAGGNIIDVTHSRLLTTVVAKRVSIGFTIETRGPEHAEEIMARLTSEGLIVRRTA